MIDALQTSYKEKLAATKENVGEHMAKVQAIISQDLKQDKIELKKMI